MSSTVEPDWELSPDQQQIKTIIKHTAAALLYWVELPEVSEIAMNRPEEVWLKLRRPDADGNVWVRRKDERLGRQDMIDILHLLANGGNTSDFGPAGTPICYGTMPGNHRYVGGYGHNLQFYNGENDVNGTVMFVCRQYAGERKISLEDYGLRPGLELARYDIEADKKQDGADPINRIMNSIKRGDHIIVSGGTDTGKTSLLNELLSRLSPKLRILSVQDTPEINIRQPNHFHIMMSRQGQTNKFDYKSVVDLIVRSTPDVIVAGEISTSNAASIWELSRSGAGSFMTTIHAENLKEATSTFATRIAHTNEAEVRDRAGLIHEMTKKFRIIQIVKNPETNERTIVQIN